jgi:glycosyltransferase involved in cell wall biosynthesis
MKSILIVANDFPYPPDHGAAVDTWALVLILAEMGYSVDLLASVREMPDETRMQAVRERVGNLWVVPRRCGLRSALSFVPFQVRSRIDLQDVMLGQRYDAVVLGADYVAPFLKNPAARETKLILRIHNEQVGYFHELADGSNKWWEKLYYYSESFKFRFFSSSVMKACDYLWFISDSDRQKHIQEDPQDDQKSFFFPMHVDPSAMRPYCAGGRTVLFLGSLTISHTLNSLAWYIKKVHPLLSDIEGYSFQVAGRTAGHPIPFLNHMVQQHRNVSLMENPVVLDGIYENAAVFVNPVIRGAGFKVKLIHALQAGLPVVTTSMGVEGTGFKDSIHLLVADTAQEFAGCVRKLLTDPVLAESLVRNAQAFLAERYDMKASIQKDLPEILSPSN